MKLKPFFILFFLGAQVFTFADRIELKNGQTASTQIVDTSGCRITIKRKDNNVQIEKTQIARIIYGTDTISYADYICPADTVPVKIRKYEETPEYKLHQMMATFPRAEVQMEKGQKIIYERYPLDGSFDKSLFDTLSRKIIDVLSTYGPVEEAAVNTLYDCFMVDSAKCPQARYLIMPYDIRTIPKENVTQTGGGMIVGNGMTIQIPTRTRTEREAETHVHFICLDLVKNQVVLDENLKATGGDFQFGRDFETFLNENIRTTKGTMDLYREQYEKQMQDNVEDIVDKFIRRLKWKYK